jgi:hypothetical protein
MFKVEVDYHPLEALAASLNMTMDQTTETAYVFPLLDQIGDLILEDNRAGVLAGLDKDGHPAPPLRYRRTQGAVAEPHRQLQRGKIGPNRGPAPYSLRSIHSHRFGTVHEPFPLGVSYVTVLPNNNLTTRQYRQLTGPRLAPRFEGSRSIANLRKLPPVHAGTDWIVDAAWVDFLDPEGEPILPHHFDATNPAMKYDLRGIRPQAREKIGELAAEWHRLLFRAIYAHRINRP